MTDEEMAEEWVTANTGFNPKEPLGKIDDKKIFIRRAWGVVPPKFEAVITDLGTSEKKKSFFKRLWQKLKSLFLRSR